MHRADKRSELAALIGLTAQIIFFGLFLILFQVNDSPATLAESWHLLAGVGIWILIFIELYQQRAAWGQRGELEDLERQRLGRLGGSESVFQSIGADEELPAERRLKVIQRWFVPIFSLLTAGFLSGLAVQMFPGSKSLAMTWMKDAWATSVNDQLPTLAVIAVATLACFVISRYTLGLSRKSEWRALRAGANYIMGNAIVSFVLVIALALSVYGVTLPERILAQAIPVLMIVLAVEIILNLVLDLYRPRIAGEEHRPSYESRLLGLFSEPEGVLHSIAQAIDYQFGFKVSETWFYQLLQGTIAWLVLFGAATLYLLSAIVIVQPGQQALITHFGKPTRILKEGTPYRYFRFLKWPWPIDKVQVFNVGQVNQLIIGFSGESIWLVPRDPSRPETTKPILWTVKHVTGSEFQLLVASKKIADQPIEKRDQMEAVIPTQPTSPKKASELTPVSILAGDLVIYYNIKNEETNGLLEYVSNYEQPELILESVAYRQWTQYMASTDPMGVMTTGRDQATATLAKLMQEELDKRKTGLQIVRVAMVGMHPPVDIAGAFESAINARQERETIVWKAQGDANQRLPRARAVEAETLSTARGEQYGKRVLEKARAQRFEVQLQSYRIAPDVFFIRNYLDVLLESAGNVRKIILAVEHPEKVKVLIDDKEKLSGGMMDIMETAAQEATKNK